MATQNTQGESTEKPEPKQIYINDVLVQLESEFPGTNEDCMPADALDNAIYPDDYPVKG